MIIAVNRPVRATHYDCEVIIIGHVIKLAHNYPVLFNLIQINALNPDNTQMLFKYKAHRFKSSCLFHKYFCSWTEIMHELQCYYGTKPDIIIKLLDRIHLVGRNTQLIRVQGQSFQRKVFIP